MTDDKSRFLSTKEAADLIGISPVSVWKAIQRGAIKAIRTGRSYQVLRESAEAYRPRTRKGKDENTD